MEWIATLERECQSHLDAYGIIIQDILGALETAGWGQRDRYTVRLALEESMTNAIRHGNQHDESKKVVVNCRIRPDRVQIEIQDEGRGFDPGDVPDCRDPENLLKTSGRGIMLMNRFMDRVEFNDVGNCVLLEKIIIEDPGKPDT